MIYKSVLVVYDPEAKRPPHFRYVLHQYLKFWFFINGSITPILYSKNSYSGIWLPSGTLLFAKSDSETFHHLMDFCVLNYLDFKHGISMIRDRVEDCIIIDKYIQYNPYTADKIHYFPEYEVDYE